MHCYRRGTPRGLSLHFDSVVDLKTPRASRPSCTCEICRKCRKLDSNVFEQSTAIIIKRQAQVLCTKKATAFNNINRGTPFMQKKAKLP